jgi:squalene/oxidosqualene cyclase-like protein
VSYRRADMIEDALTTKAPSSRTDRARAAIDRAVDNLRQRQEPDGHWAGDYGGPLFLLPGLVISCHITGTPLPRERMLAYLRHTQGKDGGYGLHVEDRSTVFGTALNYVAMRLLGASADDESCVRARQRLHALGGAEGIPTWGKFWLAVLGVYLWEGVPPLSPELYLIPRALLVNPANFWCHTRQVFLPMSYIYGRRLVGPETEIVRELRAEMFSRPFDEIDWPSVSTRVASGDLYTPHTPLLDTAYRALARYEAKPIAPLRARALAFVRDQMRHEDETTGYLTIGPVSKAIQMLAVWFDDPKSEAFAKHVARIDDYLWDAPEGTKMQGYNGSQLWDTAFAMQAILESEDGKHHDVLERAHAFVDANQIRADIPEGRRYFRDRVKGSWPFSTAEQGWSVSDCTAEGIKVAIAMSTKVARPIGEHRLRDAVDRLLESQNRDGGWSEYERARAPRLMELLNAAEVFGEIMVGYSYVECTSASIQGLRAFSSKYPGYRRRAIDRAVRRGLAFIRARQRADGSWYGGWGVCFTYATWFGIDALATTGVDHERIDRACRFLLDRQRKDGAWSESYRSCADKHWSETEESLPVQTAWALLALMGAPKNAEREQAIERGVEWLLSVQERGGSWTQTAITGAFNRNCMIHYDNYRHVMPLWALSRYVRA